MNKIIQALSVYFLQIGGLWGSLEAVTYFKDDYLKNLLGGYWYIFYCAPLLTTYFFCFYQKGNFFDLLLDLPSNSVCLEAYSEGRKAWHHDAFSFFLRKRGVLYTSGISIVIFLLDLFVLSENLFLIQHVTTFSTVLFIVTVFSFRRYLRYRSIRSLDIKYILHQLTHNIRDEHSRLLKIISNNQKNTKEACIQHFNSIAASAKDYFKKITNDDTIEVALRLAFPHPSEHGNVVYKTIVRTSGLNKNRQRTSEPISANEGVPRFLIEEHGACKILIYKNIKKAIQKDIFKETESERRFPDEIVTLMVAPLNAWDGKKVSMVGILYVTSSRRNVFREEHVDCMRFIADKISDTVSLSIKVNSMIKGNKNVKHC